MHQRIRLVIAVVVYLFTASAWGEPLSISPSVFYLFDVENFLTLRGAALGTESTVVTYTNGNTVLTVEPQLDPAAPVLSEVWVPVEVSVTLGRWDVRVVASDLGGAQRIYGPAPLDIIERPLTDVPPTLPEVLVVEAGSPSGGGFTFTPPEGVTCNYESGAPLPIGTTTVTCSAGSTTQTFAVVVADTAPPVLTLPSNIISKDATVTFTASAIDNIDGPVDVVCEPASGSIFPDGETMVQCVAQDAHANSSVGTFTVTVGDATPPVVTSTTPSVSILWPPNHKLRPITVRVVASDSVDPNPVSRIVSVSSNQPQAGGGGDDAAPDWVITGALTVKLRAERIARLGSRIYTITVDTSDFMGNTTRTTCTVTVPPSQ